MLSKVPAEVSVPSKLKPLLELIFCLLGDYNLRCGLGVNSHTKQDFKKSQHVKRKMFKIMEPPSVFFRLGNGILELLIQLPRYN